MHFKLHVPPSPFDEYDHSDVCVCGVWGGVGWGGGMSSGAAQSASTIIGPLKLF